MEAAKKKLAGNSLGLLIADGLCSEKPAALRVHSRAKGVSGSDTSSIPPPSICSLGQRFVP